MKKLFLLLAIVTASVTVASAQWGAGVRTGSGFQAVGQYVFANDNYVEARLGMNYSYPGLSVIGVMAEFSALYVWNVANFDLTRGHGNWFLDAGAGLNIGGRTHVAMLGVQGVAKFGYTFEKFPLSLSFDFAPVIGMGIFYGAGESFTGFNDYGPLNLGISAVYRF